MRKTISEDKFDQLFPEIKEYKLFIRNIDSLCPDERIKIWLNMLEAYRNYTTSIYSVQFFKKNNYWDIEPELIKIGHSLLEPLIGYLDRIIFLSEFNEKGTKEWNDTGVFSRTSNVAHLLLCVIPFLENKNSNLEIKLLDYVKKLQLNSLFVDGAIGLNLCLTARCLHKLNPKKFPLDDMSHKDNKLLNYHAYFN